MTIEDDFKWLSNLLSTLQDKALTGSEQEFVDSLSDRLEEDGKGIYVTSSQREWLERLETKYDC